MTIETVDQVRLRNLEFLLEQYKDEVRSQYPEHPERGMIKMFAERVGVSVINFRQVLNGHKLAGPNLRDRIEDALKLPRGWIDTADHTDKHIAKHTAERIARDEDEKAFNVAIMDLYKRAPESARRVMLRVMEALVTNQPLESLIENKAITRKNRRRKAG